MLLPHFSGFWIHVFRYLQILGEEEAGLYRFCVPGDPDCLFFGAVAINARGDQVFPGPLPSTGSGNDVIDGEFMVSEGFATVGASKIVPVVNHHPRRPICDYNGPDGVHPHYYRNGKLSTGAPDLFGEVILYYQTSS